VRWRAQGKLDPQSSDGLAIEVMFMRGLRRWPVCRHGTSTSDVRRSRCNEPSRIRAGRSSSRTQPSPTDIGCCRFARACPSSTGSERTSTARASSARQRVPSGERRADPTNNRRKRVWAAAMKHAEIVTPPTPHAARRTTSSLLTSTAARKHCRCHPAPCLWKGAQRDHKRPDLLNSLPAVLNSDEVARLFGVSPERCTRPSHQPRLRSMLRRVATDETV
jgi:hypothetical protein